MAAYLGGSRAAALRVPLPARQAADYRTAPDSGRRADGPLHARSRHARVTRSRRRAADRAAASSSSAAARPASSNGSSGTRIARLLALELRATKRSIAPAISRGAGSSFRPPARHGPCLIARQVRRPAATPTIAEREEMRARLRLLAPPAGSAFRGDAESLELRLVLALDAGDGSHAAPADVGAAAACRARLGRVRRTSRRPFDRSHSAVPSAEAESRATLEAAEALAGSTGRARGDRLAAYRLLAALGALPDGQRHARALLGPLLVGSRDAQSGAARDRPGRPRAPGLNEAAAALGVHRNTLAYRIRRIEALDRLATSPTRNSGCRCSSHSELVQSD